MARTEVLERIKEAEAKVADELRKARDFKSERAKTAILEAQRIEAEGEAKANAEARKVLEAARTRTKMERAKLVEDGAARTEVERKKAEARLQEAVDMVLQEFEKRVMSR
jgi:V/A-type H+-transporting ATPase subunit G/H